jgi:nucleotide-binding universal stress UspA family protein
VATAHVVERPPAEAVLEASATADLVVLGTHGRRGPKRWWLGSVAERVVREAPVPVMVIHAGDDAARSEPREVIVLGDPPAPEVLEWAEAIAAAAGATVRQGPPVDQCASAAASSRAVMAVPLEQSPAGKTVHPGLAALARDCPAPVLFVPVPRYAETIA